MFERRLVLIPLAALCGAILLWADDAPPAPLKVGGITVTGGFRTRAEDWNWFQPDSGNNSYLYSGNLFRIAFSQSREFLDWQLEFAAPFLLGLPDNAIAAGTQG